MNSRRETRKFYKIVSDGSDAVLLETLIDWDGPFPSDVATAHFNNMHVTCLTPGYHVHRYEHKGIWLNPDATISVCLQLEIRSTTTPARLLLAPPLDAWREVHDELKTNDTAWRDLAFDGIQSDGQGGLLENRRCPECGSTLGRATLPIHALALCQQFADVHARSLDAISSSIHLAQTQVTRLRRRRGR